MSDFASLSNSVWFLVKIFFLVGISVYLIFAVVLIKQVNLMLETVEETLDGFLRTVARAHLVFALAVFLIALFTL